MSMIEIFPADVRVGDVLHEIACSGSSGWIKILGGPYAIDKIDGDCIYSNKVFVVRRTETAQIRAERPDPGYSDILPAEIVLGDRIAGWTRAGIYIQGMTDGRISYPPIDSFFSDPNAGTTTACAGGKKIINITTTSASSVRVLLPRPGQSTSAKAPPPLSSWNGRCKKCGRGTYTGLFSVEHEGGNCG